MRKKVHFWTAFRSEIVITKQNQLCEQQCKVPFAQFTSSHQ